MKSCDSCTVLDSCPHPYKGDFSGLFCKIAEDDMKSGKVEEVKAQRAKWLKEAEIENKHNS